jgi:hypothetical protein
MTRNEKTPQLFPYARQWDCPNQRSASMTFFEPHVGFFAITEDVIFCQNVGENTSDFRACKKVS